MHYSVLWKNVLPCRVYCFIEVITAYVYNAMTSLRLGAFNAIVTNNVWPAKFLSPCINANPVNFKCSQLKVSLEKGSNWPGWMYVRVRVRYSNLKLDSEHD